MCCQYSSPMCLTRESEWSELWNYSGVSTMSGILKYFKWTNDLWHPEDERKGCKRSKESWRGSKARAGTKRGHYDFLSDDNVMCQSVENTTLGKQAGILLPYITCASNMSPVAVTVNAFSKLKLMAFAALVAILCFVFGSFLKIRWDSSHLNSLT